MSGQRKSIPAMSRPTMRAARSASARLSGWIAELTSTAMPPVLIFAVRRNAIHRPRSGMESAVRPY